jgi:Ni/Co efflux regulator RcnB
MRMLLGVLLVSVAFAAPAAAKPKHWHESEKHWKKHSQDHDDDHHDRGHHAKSCYFEPREVRVIREYYEPRFRSLPPGLGKKFYRTGHLPPGWEKRMEPLPVVVERRLVPLPSGYRRGYIDGSIIVYAPRTEIVVDVVAFSRP